MCVDPFISSLSHPFRQSVSIDFFNDVQVLDAKAIATPDQSTGIVILVGVLGCNGKMPRPFGRNFIKQKLLSW
jgi:hypothetical protein